MRNAPLCCIRRLPQTKAKFALVGEIMQYRGLIAKTAWGCWRRLPMQTRVWLGIEELIDDGILHLIKFERMWRKFDGQDRLRAIGHTLVLMYDTQYLDPYVRAQKRFKVWTDENGIRQEYGRTISMDGLAADYRECGLDFEPERILKLEIEFRDPLIACGAVQLLIKLYQDASEHLKGEMTRWFLKTGETKFHIHNPKFLKARKEFRSLANAYNFQYIDAKHLIQSPGCLDVVSRQIMQIPFDLNHPTPNIRGYEA